LPEEFRWRYEAPVLDPRAVGRWEWISVKDPSIVRYGDCWHLFCTVRGPERSHAIIYLNFVDFGEANRAERYVLSCHPGYFCAPQVFYFRPQEKWYLICQAADPAWGDPPYRPAFTTTADIADPSSWARLQPMYENKPENLKGWLDFWVICDDVRAYLFFTSLNGKMWRAETLLCDFPKGWSKPAVALEADVFEASHTYHLVGIDSFLTVIEAQHGHGWRYYKAYLADRLDGLWQPLAGTKDHAFASMRNVAPSAARWTDVISHGELLRAGFGERLQVDPANLRLLFQGVLDKDRQGKNYGQIPWRIGLLQPVGDDNGK
jgi:hypothetical protein